MNVRDIDILYHHNTGNKEKNRLIDSFVLRTKPFNHILFELKLSQTDKPEQSYMVIGPHGSGKTTLLYRLKYAIEDDPDLNKSIIPVMFTEEQYNMLDLIDLWESIGEHLKGQQGFRTLVADTGDIDSSNRYREEETYELLEKELNSNNKKIIVFIENIDRLFKKLGSPGQKRLRAILTTSNTIRLIGSSTFYFADIINYSSPFYEFFKIIQLDGLNAQESNKLLLMLAEQKNQTSRIQKIIKQYPGRLETIRRLTGGNPRAISYLFQFLLDDQVDNAIIDLYRLLDAISFMYKASMDQLSSQQQKVVDAIARRWDAISTKELSGKTGMDSKHVSSILKTLERNQVVESISTKTKNNLYRLKDRLLNLWYLTRHGETVDKKNVIWLVRFLNAWCCNTALSQRIYPHTDQLKKWRCNVYSNETTNDSTLPASLAEENISLDLENINLEKIKARIEIQISKGMNKAYYIFGRHLLQQEMNVEAEAVLLMGAKKKDADSAHLLGHYYCELNNWPKAEKYFLESIKFGRQTALMCLFKNVFINRMNNRKLLVLKQFERYLPEINQQIILTVQYASILLWNEQVEKSISILNDAAIMLLWAIEENNEEAYKEEIISELSRYFILLISKGLYNAANDLFQNKDINYRHLLKPVYYAMMDAMKEKFPKEHLKAGRELRETIDEIIKEIAAFKDSYA